MGFLPGITSRVAGRMIIHKLLGMTVCAAFFHLSASNERCPSIASAPKYHLIEKCRRSQMSVIARANFASLSSCQRLAAERRGLALNFSPSDVASTLDYDEDEPFYSCEVLKCPESLIELSLRNDSRYDYYSLYADPLPNVNTSCISTVGIFSLERSRLNYTEAAAHCEELQGGLAEPATETRTNELALLLSGSGLDSAYVGMRSEADGSFRHAKNRKYQSTNGQHLECTTYRAWAPGHPKRHLRGKACVAVHRKKMWQGVRCDARLPFICELSPGGPLPQPVNIPMPSLFYI